MEMEWRQNLRYCGELEVKENDGKWQTKMDRATEFWKVRWPEQPFISILARYCFTQTSSSAAVGRARISGIEAFAELTSNEFNVGRFK